MKRLQKAEELLSADKAESGPMEIDTHSERSPADTKRNKNGDDTSSPLKKTPKTSGPSSPLPATPDTSKLTPKKDPAALEAVKVDRDNRALNLNLEFALQLTLRADAAVDSIKYCGHEGITPATSLLNAGNISELICGRLTEQTENAVLYLSGCYKRIVAKESSASPVVQAELAKYVLFSSKAMPNCFGNPCFCALSPQLSKADHFLPGVVPGRAGDVRRQ